MTHVTVLAIENGLASSITIPLEMIRAADVIRRIRQRGAPKNHIAIASHDGNPAVMTGGISIMADQSVAQIQKTDLIFIPALWGNPNATVKNTQRSAPGYVNNTALAQAFAVLGLAVISPAHAGLLNDRSATTHWYYFDDFHKRYPKTKLQRKRFITHADNLYCTGSVNAVRDVALHFVEQLFTPEIADEVAHHFTHELKRSYESMLLADEEKNSHHDEQIIKIQEWLQKHYKQAISLKDLAQKFDLSVRSFNRRFRNAADKTPLEYLQEIRLEQAKSLLKHSNLTVAEIAYEIGYQDTSSFTSLFKRTNGVTPKEYRHLVRTKLFNVDTE